MEIANLERADIRLAAGRDSEQILRLLNEAAYTHLHADWHAPGDWIGTPGFVVAEGPAPSGSLFDFGRTHTRTNGQLQACLAVAADPPPAAWVRMAALRRRPLALENISAMLEAVLPYLRETGVAELGWLAVDSWPDDLLPGLGFRRANWITTFVKEGLDTPPVPVNGVEVRPARIEEMPALAAIEKAAFDPLWRHSAEGLRMAYGQSLCFDVALIAGEIVGFQYSASNHHGLGAHLVRITVHPSAQGTGVGSALLNAAFQEYRRRGIRRVSLNTQLDNTSSHRLYEKFGFGRTGDQLPVWVMNLGRGYR
jgi:ribosomal protein S18 acetylase RimI-like enzyme